MWEMNDNFQSKIAPRNLYSLTTGIYVSSSFMSGSSLCIFLNWQKYTHHVLLWDILNPFVFAQCVILLMHCCSWRSHIFWSGSDTEVVNVKIIINSRSKTPCSTVNFYIKQCRWQNTPLSDSLFLSIEISKRWSDSDSELPVQEKTLYEVWQSSSQSKAMKIFHYSELPSDLVSLLQIKEDWYQMSFLYIVLSYGGFQFDLMIHCWSEFSEATLRVGNKFIGFKIPV